MVDVDGGDVDVLDIGDGTQIRVGLPSVRHLPREHRAQFGESVTVAGDFIRSPEDMLGLWNLNLRVHVATIFEALRGGTVSGQICTFHVSECGAVFLVTVTQIQPGDSASLDG